MRLWGQRAPCKPRTVLGLGKNGVSPVAFGLHNAVIGFGHTNAEFINTYGFHIVTVCLHHIHLQSGNANVVKSHGGRVDKTQPYPLIGAEQSGPVCVWCAAIH